jgi:hypothetical protein
MAHEAIGQLNIVPIWHGVDARRIAEFSPILAGKIAASTTDGVQRVARLLLESIRPNLRQSKAEVLDNLVLMSSEIQDFIVAELRAAQSSSIDKKSLKAARNAMQILT